MITRVIYPQGLPDAHASRQACRQLLQQVGEVSEVLIPEAGEPWPELVERTRALAKSAAGGVLVMLTAPLPITEVVALRKELELAVPQLLSAKWLVVLPGDTVDRFTNEAPDLGCIEGTPDDAALWLTRAGDFVLVPDRLVRSASLLARLQSLESSSPSSRRIPAIGTGYSERPHSSYATDAAPSSEPPVESQWRVSQHYMETADPHAELAAAYARLAEPRASKHSLPKHVASDPDLGPLPEPTGHLASASDAQTLGRVQLIAKRSDPALPCRKRGG